MKEIGNTKYAYSFKNGLILKLYSGEYLYFDNNEVEMSQIGEDEVENILKNKTYSQHIGLPLQYIIKDIQYKLVDKFTTRRV